MARASGGNQVDNAAETSTPKTSQRQIMRIMSTPWATMARGPGRAPSALSLAASSG